MPQGLSAELAEADADPDARQPLPTIVTPRRIGFFLIGGAAYVLALVASWPARFTVAAGPRWAIAGTIWYGEAILDGTYRLEWRWSPARSLATFTYAADVHLSGNGTDIGGTGIRIANGYRFEGLSGHADGGLLAALAPKLPFACETPLEVDLRRLEIAGSRSAAEGEIRSAGGTCTPKGSENGAAVPPLVARAVPAPHRATVMTLTSPGHPDRLLDAAMLNGRLTVVPTPAGTALLPLLAGFRIDEPL